VAIEATGNQYWIVEEIEQAGLQPRLVHSRKAKLMMGLINKTGKLDAHGLNRLQRSGTLPDGMDPNRAVARSAGTTPRVHALSLSARWPALWATPPA
jgi:hypothetical protein